MMRFQYAKSFGKMKSVSPPSSFSGFFQNDQVVSMERHKGIVVLNLPAWSFVVAFYQLLNGFCESNEYFPNVICTLIISLIWIYVCFKYWQISYIFQRNLELQHAESNFVHTDV